MSSARFLGAIAEYNLDLTPIAIDALQMNITRLCNQACSHCHVAASPRRTEMMTDDVIERCLEIVSQHAGIRTADITGGAPELHPGFEPLVSRLRGLDRHVVVRHNLTVTLDPHPLTGESMSHLPEMFADHGVELACSLPWYGEEETDHQRGAGTFAKSIESLRRLNGVGYGSRIDLLLDLVVNPGAATLLGDQRSLEAEFRRALEEDHGLTFDRLFVLANMPVGRYAKHLDAVNDADGYLGRLEESCNPSAAGNAMCLSTVSVSHDGTLYDCDFNQMLGLAIGDSDPLTVFDFDEAKLMRRRIRFADHCLGCAAGAGSSCSGATAPVESPSRMGCVA
ncbi:MAG: arsenosugar biosynthesis radical SAM protein ArsS [Coriobacteriia bacterium]|nr:arsenosugar biosynthesis radical SAM protein ArsS [Coriobacteriia bacterium]